jgi:hypothetical protein
MSGVAKKDKVVSDSCAEATMRGAFKITRLACLPILLLKEAETIESREKWREKHQQKRRQF